MNSGLDLCKRLNTDWHRLHRLTIATIETIQLEMMLSLVSDLRSGSILSLLPYDKKTPWLAAFHEDNGPTK
jgi:hypothetical protein